MSLETLKEIINHGNFDQFYEFIIGLDSICENIIEICADFIFDPFEEKYFEILYNEVSNKSPEKIPNVFFYCICNNNIKSLELLVQYGFDMTTLISDTRLKPFNVIYRTCSHAKCQKKCEYEILIKFFLDNGFYSCIDQIFFSAIENRKYCACDVLLNCGYSINYSNPNIMDIISTYIGDGQSLGYLLNKCDLQINFSHPRIKKSILYVIKYKNYKCLQLLINLGLNLYDLVKEIDKVKENEYLSGTLKILIDHGFDTETICKLFDNDW
ncbi:ankyrin repeat-containing protein [Moumouvirus maliensis]|nr:ankyrin repeat-containing protein [Moumouvirus maliensis]